MKIMQLLKEKQENMVGKKPITIAFLGDSVTHGCFECYTKSEGEIETVFDYKNAYSYKLRELLSKLYPNVQINIVNSGISGDTSEGGLKRLERDVLVYRPDLTVVSYGLNDCCVFGDDRIDAYAGNITDIIRALKAVGSEVIFLTQNSFNTSVSVHLKEPILIEYAQAFVYRQGLGTLKRFFARAKQICKDEGVEYCDIYEVWDKMIEAGVDVTELLANKLNHPIREFHDYIAGRLLDVMLGVQR